MKKRSLIILLFALLCNAAALWAQPEGVETKTNADKFQDYFYEALKQKGIENYDKAIVSLQQCLKLEPQNAVLYFELGKNYLAQKDYRNAFTSFQKASEIDPTNKWFWIGMYDVNYATKDYEGAIKTIDKLIKFDPKFKEDLTSLYMNTGQFDAALDLINELNQTVGKSDRRESYKLQILSQGKYQNAEIANLLQQISKFPQEESNYISLIYYYSKNDDINKVLETAQKLEKAIPTSEWAQVSLFKFHLDKNDGAKAVTAMNTVLASPKIDNKIKHRILNEFLIYAYANPQYMPDVEKAVRYFDSDPNVNVAKEIGKYHQNKKNYKDAIRFYDLANEKSKTVDIETNLLLLQAHTELGQFDAVVKKSNELLELFPAQPQFYFYAGLGFNQLKQFKKGKDVLEMGMDYVVEDIPLEANFYIQLGEAYNGLGDVKKKEFYFGKANQLLKQKN